MLNAVFVMLLLSHVDIVLQLHSQDINMGIDGLEFWRSISQLSELTKSFRLQTTRDQRHVWKLHNRYIVAKEVN